MPFVPEDTEFGAFVRGAKKRQDVSLGKVVNSNPMLERMVQKYGLSKEDAKMFIVGLFPYRSYN